MTDVLGVAVCAWEHIAKIASVKEMFVSNESSKYQNPTFASRIGRKRKYSKS